jgi:hypothetical protein
MSAICPGDELAGDAQATTGVFAGSNRLNPPLLGPIRIDDCRPMLSRLAQNAPHSQPRKAEYARLRSRAEWKQIGWN